MNWATIKEAVRQAVVSATGIDEQRVQWVNNPEAGTWRETPLVDLVLRNPRAIGVDETRTTYNEETDALEATQEGPREFTVSIRIETESQLDAEESVGQLASDLRTRLRRKGVKAALLVAGVSLARMERTVDSDFTADRRTVSLSVTDVVFCAAETDADSTYHGDYIETVEISSPSMGVPEFTVTISED